VKLDLASESSTNNYCSGIPSNAFRESLADRIDDKPAMSMAVGLLPASLEPRKLGRANGDRGTCADGPKYTDCKIQSVNQHWPPQLGFEKMGSVARSLS